MQLEINDILSGSGITADYSYATDPEYNIVFTSQITKWDAINKILDDCEHIAYLDGATLWVVDKLVGSVVVDLPYFRVLEGTADFASEIVSTVTAQFSTKAHNDGGLAGTPSLQESPQSINVDTGLVGGIDKVVFTDIQATTHDTVNNEIDYSTLGLAALLERKKQVLLREQVTLKLRGFHEYTAGTKLTFDTDYESGYLVLTEKTFNVKDLTTTVVGLGQYTNKEY